MSDNAKKGFSLKAFYTDVTSEVRKVIWPTKEELINQTIIVIVTSALIAAVICGFDVIYEFGHQYLAKLLG